MSHFFLSIVKICALNFFFEYNEHQGHTTLHSYQFSETFTSDKYIMA